MSSCSFEELASHVAAMLKQGVPQETIDRFLEMLSSDYRAEVLAAAHDLLGHEPSQP
jgi:hypothetical protein